MPDVPDISRLTNKPDIISAMKQYIYLTSKGPLPMSTATAIFFLQNNLYFIISCCMFDILFFFFLSFIILMFVIFNGMVVSTSGQKITAENLSAS